ncbi:MAG: hypothetical protein M3Y48_09510 [Actinomycetota bacterium]|nr:hypothetical protein [Actinomycetota bacterium]
MDPLAGDLYGRLRAAQGILALADMHGAQHLDTACARSPAVGDPSYRTVKGVLALGVETVGTPTAPPEVPGGESPSVATPAHLHSPDGLFDHPPQGSSGCSPPTVN